MLFRSARQLLGALQRSGWLVERQRGSHILLVHPLRLGRITVPNHAGRILLPKTLDAILDQASMTVDELRALL